MILVIPKLPVILLSFDFLNRDIMNNYRKTLFLIIIVTMGVWGMSCNQNNDDGLEERIEETRHLQSHRREIMDGMLEGGLATRIENPNSQPYIYVTEPFFMLPAQDQASLMNVIWYYFITEDREADVLAIYDNNTGEQKGTFSTKGLLMSE